MHLLNINYLQEDFRIAVNMETNSAKSVSSFLSEFMTQVHWKTSLSGNDPETDIHTVFSLQKLPGFCGLYLHHTCQKEKKRTHP